MAGGVVEVAAEVGGRGGDSGGADPARVRSGGEWVGLRLAPARFAGGLAIPGLWVWVAGWAGCVEN